MRTGHIAGQVLPTLDELLGHLLELGLQLVEVVQQERLFRRNPLEHSLIQFVIFRHIVATDGNHIAFEVGAFDISIHNIVAHIFEVGIFQAFFRHTQRRIHRVVVVAIGEGDHASVVELLGVGGGEAVHVGGDHISTLAHRVIEGRVVVESETLDEAGHLVARLGGQRLDFAHHLVGVAHRVEAHDTEADAAVGRGVVEDIDELGGAVFQLLEVGLAKGSTAVEHQHHHHHLVGLEVLLGILHLAVTLPGVGFPVILPLPEFQAAGKTLGVVGAGLVESKRDGLVGLHLAVDSLHRGEVDTPRGDVGELIDEPSVLILGDGIITFDIIFGLLGLGKCGQSAQHAEH